jgi:hypothetical protein
MAIDDDKYGGDGITLDMLQGALLMARTEPRASISCALAVLQEAFFDGSWTQDRHLREFMRHVMQMNHDAGITNGMTDPEAEAWTIMVACITAACAEGGAA